MELSKKLTGKTILSCESIRAEYGRTYDVYHCIVFIDGSKLMITGGEPWEPDPPIDEMRKAPTFFTTEDIVKKVEKMENQRRQQMKEEQDRKIKEFERLKKELNK